MWLYKRTIPFLLFLFSVPAFGQNQDDTLFFVRYAATLDQLFPGTRLAEPYNSYARDSVSFHENAKGKTLCLDRKIAYYQKDTSLELSYEKHVFDYLVRKTEYLEMNQDSIVQRAYYNRYRNSFLISMFVETNPQVEKTDSVFYEYNKAGLLSSVCYHKHDKRSDSTYCSNRLYNNQGQLLVYENRHYGPVLGNYVFGYDEQGRLVRRQFLHRTIGAILCTDSIQYNYDDAEKRYLTQKHYIRITGIDRWILIDELKTDTKLNKVVYRNVVHRHRNGPMVFYGPGTIEYTYDSEGRMTSKSVNSADTKYYDVYRYSAERDSVLHYRLEKQKNSEQERAALVSVYVIDYDKKGLRKRNTYYEYEMRKRKRKYYRACSAMITEEYKWK